VPSAMQSPRSPFLDNFLVADYPPTVQRSVFFDLTAAAFLYYFALGLEDNSLACREKESLAWKKP